MARSSAMNAYLFHIITLFVGTSGNSEGICPEKTTLLRAIHCCESQGENQYLPTIQSHEDKLLAGTFIGEGETWVNLKLTVSKEWKSTGERDNEHVFTIPEWKYKGGTCGTVKKRDSYISTMSCSQQGLGAICERPDCESCMGLGRLGYNCFHLEKRCYAVYCGLRNWYDARALCRRFGMDLAPPEERVLHQFSKSHMPFIPAQCKHVWIGLYRNSWEQIKHLAGEKVTIPLWAQGHPDNTGSCAILRRFNYGDYLMTADCNATHGYICKAYAAREAKDSTERILSTQSYKDTYYLISATSAGPVWILLSISVFTTLTLIAFLLVICVSCRNDLCKEIKKDVNKAKEEVPLRNISASGA